MSPAGRTQTGGGARPRSAAPALVTALLAALLLLPRPGLGGMGPDRGFPVVNTPGVYGGAAYPQNGYSALCVACHTRNPSTHVAAWAADHRGTHFVFGGSGVQTGNLAWEKLDAWSETGGLSRYGGAANQSVTGTAGEVICESCHNIRRNTGKNRLLATDNATTDPSPLCSGCHGTTGPGHHLLTNDLSSLHAGTLNNADSAYVRNPPLANSEATYPGTNAVNCRSCHAPHGGWTQAGARALKRGERTPGGAGVLGVAVTGIERSAENPVTPGAPVVLDQEPLCNGCHKVSY